MTGNKLFNDMFELESIVFPGERFHDVIKNEQMCMKIQVANRFPNSSFEIVETKCPWYNLIK